MEELYQIFITSTGIQTDTRKIIDGQLFYALSGDNFDGNTYIEQALSKGAIHAVSSDQKWANDPRVTVVQDTLKNLQELATYHRNKLNIPILSLTGSNGKTTTKGINNICVKPTV
ncbi:UDP-N-acetylmuramoylalanyl-D-glutamyl-2,6-diaminopimelate-D-alanyl-D-alanine ligase [Nonlabens ulvanivorans]|nr:UDP-N-acetylmuramoylalanyl-D-glutamyl-2,6-diaminopimelate-D-alanyl-D-alanine ligase [Nonlabens ulvanivorans]